MSLSWGDFRAQVRRTVLKSTNEAQWSNEVLRDCVWWALDTFSAHTAVATSVTFDATGTTYVLPDHLIESVETAGLVYLLANGSRTYLPSYLEPGRDDADLTFQEWPARQLVLASTPATGAQLVVHYFAAYNHPYADSDSLDVPVWAVPALAFMTGVHALTSVSVNAGNIRQWNDENDSGNPEHNPLLALQRHLLTLYDSHLTRYPRQDRQNFWTRYQR